MFCHIAMQNPPRTDLHGNKDIQNPERRCHRNKKIAGDDPLGVVPHEGRPALAGAPPARPIRIQILSNRSGRDSDAKLEKQFVSDSLLAPGRIAPIHLADQFDEILRQRRAPALARFPSPKYPKGCSLPLDERLRLDDRQRVLPIEESGQGNHGHPSCRRLFPAFYSAFLEQCELFSQKKILGNERRARGQEEADQREQLQSLQPLAGSPPGDWRTRIVFFADHRDHRVLDRLAYRGVPSAVVMFYVNDTRPHYYLSSAGESADQ